MGSLFSGIYDTLGIMRAIPCPNTPMLYVTATVNSYSLGLLFSGSHDPPGALEDDHVLRLSFSGSAGASFYHCLQIRSRAKVFPLFLELKTEPF